ncbi:winged helix-turn-helix domain-containing protein [Acidianus ambivalens]|uniref:Winged helix-turn-helix transcriptional regulator n=1 Tax=Acidianus ambivalens TaxID=2283 RepID=A0A650CSY4_ACIAM|nr:winged helix-turn-helix domain-containing protein [Acidianus ambivalens]MQL55379.1 winged helix-turn-helix transcriptional regulator [Acidianus ambivalens]QGR20918.1 winged helix-turn-helix transcriptional regulator [Acidianus ambivalens]
MESNISSYENLIQEKILEKGNEGISQQELAKSVGLSTRELSMIVKRLIEKKVIVKRTVKENGKSVVKLFAAKSSSINNDIYINLDTVKEIPCFSCKLLYKCNNGAHVNPGSCSKLSEWILYLVG